MKKLMILGLITPFLLIASCKKSESIKVMVPGHVSDASDFVEKFGPKKQYYSMLTTDLPKTLILDNGSRITVPANSIQHNGNYVTGDVTVEVYEYLQRSDIILAGLNTNHIDGSPIESKGMLFIDILHNKESSDLTLKNLMNISIPATQAGNMKICSGTTNANGSHQMAWGPQLIDSINTDGSSYNFQTMMIGWLNGGNYFAPGNTKGTFTVTLLNNPGTLATAKGEQGNTFVYFCPKGSNVAMQLNISAGADKVKTADNAMPLGIDGKLIAFSIKDNKFYYAESDINTANKNMELLSLTELDALALVAKIKELNSY